MTTTEEALWALLALAVMYMGSIAVAVTGGAVVARWLARHDEMDEHQARVFASFRPSLRARVYGQWVEVLVAAFDIALRGLWLLHLLPVPRDPGSGTPVVMLPGYTENAGALWWFARKLRQRGFRPFLIDFPSTFHSIDRNAAFLRARLREICEATGSDRVAIVAHSMGGVVARTLLLSDPNHCVLTLIAVSSPFRGTHIARLGAFLGLGESVIDMCPASPFAHRFVPSATSTVPIRVIIGEQENIVSPPWSCVLPGCDVHLLSMPVGHDAPLYLTESYERIETWLEQAGVRRQSTASGREAPRERQSTASGREAARERQSTASGREAPRERHSNASGGETPREQSDVTAPASTRSA